MAAVSAFVTENSGLKFYVFALAVFVILNSENSIFQEPVGSKSVYLL